MRMLNTRCICSSVMGTRPSPCNKQQDPSVKEDNNMRAGAGEDKVLPYGWEGVEVMH